MKTITRDEITGIFLLLDIQPGDGLLVHSALQFLGQPDGGPIIYLEALCEVSGCELGVASLPQLLTPPPETGTIAVPTFNFSFAKGEPYDPQTTPSVGMGTFSELVRQHPAARRTPHPMQSLAVIGKYRDELISRDTPSAFDPGSAFERMLDLDFKLLLLGADVYAASIIHYSEQRACVPYRYWKDFTGTILSPLLPGRGAKSEDRGEVRTYRMFVRDLDLDPHLTLKPVESLLRQRSQWLEKPLNYGRIATCRLRDFVHAADDLLATDPWALVENRPKGRS